MRTGKFPRRYPHFVRAFLLGALLTSLTTTGAGAREIELGARLEGFPFSSAYSVAASRDGRDLYASGSLDYNVAATAGLVWLRRDPATGRLAFQRNYLSTGAEPAVFGSVLSADEGYLFALGANEVTTLARAADGALTLAANVLLPAAFRPQAIHRLPSGEILVHGLAGNRLYAASPNGELTLRQTLDAVPLYRDLLALDDATVISGGAVLKLESGAWNAQPLSAITSAIGFAGNLLASPDRRYFYSFISEGTFPQIGYYCLTLELSGGRLIEASRSLLNLNWELERTAAAIHPTSGDLYVASYSTNGGDHGRIEQLRAAGAGRSFTGGAPLLYDSSDEYDRRTAKDSLIFSADGRHLYATFGHEPVALLEVDPALGTLSHQPGAAGPHSRFERPFGLLAARPGELFVLTPHAVLEARIGGSQPELISSLESESWDSGPLYRPLRGLALDAGGGIGVLASTEGLVMVERNPADQALRAVPGTGVDLDGADVPAVSPDGRYAYVPGSNTIMVYRLERDVPRLAVVQNLAGLSGRFLLAPDGTRAAILRNGRLTLLDRSAASGQLSLAAQQLDSAISNVFDAAWGGDGRKLHLFRSGGEFGSRLELMVRQPDGSWSRVAVAGVTEGDPDSRLLAAGGHDVFLLDELGLELHGLVNFYPNYTPAFLGSRSRGELGGAGAPLDGGDPSDLPPAALEMLAEESDLALAHRDTGNVQLFRRACSSFPYVFNCLAERRFRVEVDWRDAQGLAWPAQVAEYGSDDAQVFSFFDRQNWEMMVKVLDGCGINDRFWVFAAASTDVGFEIRVTDTWTGERKVFGSPAGAPAPAITDSSAFATCAAPSPGWTPSPPPERAPLAEAAALILDGRFEAEVRWTNHQGQSGPARGLGQTTGTPQSGLFYFFDRDNWEMQVKVLDGCAINGHHWVLGAATTDVGYTLDIRDLPTGRNWSYTNPVGRASPAIIDIEAFACD